MVCGEFLFLSLCRKISNQHKEDVSIWHPHVLQHQFKPLDGIPVSRAEKNRFENQRQWDVSVISVVDYITSHINITVRERQWQFLWLLPTHSFYFSEDLISVTLRGKNSEELSQCFSISELTHLARCLKPLRVKCTFKICGSQNSSAENNCNLWQIGFLQHTVGMNPWRGSLKWKIYAAPLARNLEMLRRCPHCNA